MTVTILILVLLAVIVCFSVISYKKKLDSGCCGGGSEKVKSKGVKDKNKSHYPYTKTLTVDGMVCTNCSHHVENALNAIEGVWAVVDLNSKKATVRMKSVVADADLRKAVSEAGYTVLKIE